MSTLTSAQLHVKRSSTRLHAPPGGASSITFGPGGLGTVDAAGEDSEKAADPAMRPPPRTSGAYSSSSSSNNNHYGSGSSYDYAPSTAMYAKAGGAMPSSAGSSYTSGGSSFGYASNNESNWSNQYAQTPPSAGGHGPVATSYGGRPLSSSSSASSSRSWGSQPPLTSSKRDQNWERKRRQWLARKNGASRPQTMTPPQSLPVPPGSAYGISGTGLAAPMPRMHTSSNPWDDLASANAPPSPLSKFVHQQSQKQSFGAAVDYERIGTAQSYGAPPPLTAGSYSNTNSSSIGSNSSGYGGGAGAFAFTGAPPSRSGFASYSAPPPTSSGATNVSHLRQAPSDPRLQYGQALDGAPMSRGGVSGAPAGVSTSGGYGPGPGTSATARQPPGGRSNWSPFS